MRHVRVFAILTVLATCAATEPRAAQGPQQTPPTGAISGVVVDAVTKQPIDTAMVTLGGNKAERMLTDARGRFLFRGLAPADAYIVTANKSGYLDGRFGALPRTARPIRLSAGQWVGDANVEMIPTGAISGTVIDEHGDPVVAAPVRVMAWLPIAGRRHLVVGQIVRSDDRGQYRIVDLAAGSYLVQVPSAQNTVLKDIAAMTPPSRNARPPMSPDDPALDLDRDTRLAVGSYVTPAAAADGRLMAYPATFYPAATDMTAATAIELTPGQSREGVDVTLKPLPTVKVSGQLQGLAGSPAGMLLRLVPKGLEELGLASEAATTVADPSGRFTFLNVPPGQYVFDMRASFMEYRYRSNAPSNLAPVPTPGFGSSSGGGGDILAAPPGTSYSYAATAAESQQWARDSVEVGSVDVANLVIPVRGGSRLSGRVVREVPTSATPGAPANQGPTIVIVSPADGNSSLGMFNALANTPDGTFDVGGLGPGRYTIRPASGRVKSILWNGRDVTNTPVDASSGQDITGVLVTLTDETTTFEGTVSGTRGPADAAVIVYPVEPQQWVDYGFRPARIQSVAVDTTGHFRTTALPAGEYYAVAVNAAQADAWLDPAFLERAARDAAGVTLSWGGTTARDLKLSEVR